MTDFFDRLHRFSNRMMGLKPRRGPDDPKPLYATLQDRIFASAMDLGLVVFLCFDLFNWMTRKIYGNFDMDSILTASPLLEGAPAQDHIRLWVEGLFESGFAELWLMNSIMQSLVAGVLLLGCWVGFNTTPGKWIVGLKLADKETLEPPAFGQYLKRFLGFYASLPPFMLGFLLLGINKKKQAWHDRMADTVVIYNEAGSILHRMYRFVRGYLKKP